MKAKIAVATVSGKAYYLIVSELKKKNVSFLSLKPNDDIPLDVKAVITTKKERSKITHQNVLEYEESKKLAEIVDEAIRIVKGKKIYERLVVGVDPGQNFGVAVLGDGNILETEDCTSASETVDTIKNVLSRTPANHITIRIGNGAPSYTEELWRNLDDAIPRNIVIESVGEEGTSQCLGETAHRRGKRDVSSAIKIAQRQGKILPRRKNDD
ncbi:hypothetical protein KAU88_00380 [Candidatus Bathyarchaeota archaeon]|nr:hypothetical protein [Candidatus Bathyarchaeota archaeon]